MTKNLVITKMLFRNWLIKQGYKPEEIRFNRRGSPDFILADGKRFEVKRPVSGFIYFTDKQWNSLNDDDEIVIMYENLDSPLGITKFKSVREAHSKGKSVVIGGRRYGVVVGRRKSRVTVWCSEKTKKRFESLYLKSGFSSYEGFLSFLLDCAERFLETRSV